MALDFILAAAALILLLYGAFCVALYLLSGRGDSPIEMSPPDRKRNLVKGIIVITLSIGLVVLTTMLTIVPAGNVGVRNTFGVVDEDVFQSGLYLKSPFTDVIPMSIQSKKYMDYGSSDVATIIALSNDGLSTTMGIAVNYHLNPALVSKLYKNVGTGYESVAMVNPIHSVPRDLISKYDTKTLYSASVAGSADRARLEQELYSGIQERIEGVGVPGSVVIEQVSIRNIDFPQAYKDTITSKMNMDTDIAKKKLEVTLQELEASRVRAQAQGIADKQRIEADGAAYANEKIASSVTKESLQWYAIKMMESHPGAVYYIPIGQDGLFHPELVQQVAQK